MNVLCANSIDVSRRGNHILFETSFSVSNGEMVGLIGPNGAGKTTLLRALVGLQSPQSGSISLNGADITESNRAEVARKISYLAQSSTSFWPLAVENLVMLGRMPHLTYWQRPSDVDYEVVQRAMKSCDVDQFAERPVSTLSGGEQARAMLARALATEPEILLADEPIAGLDPAHQLDVMDKLQDLVSQGAGVVAVMHDLSIAARYCDRLCLLFEGRVYSEGTADEVLSEQILQHCYGVEAHFGQLDDKMYVIPKRRLTRN